MLVNVQFRPVLIGVFWTKALATLSSTCTRTVMYVIMLLHAYFAYQTSSGKMSHNFLRYVMLNKETFSSIKVLKYDWKLQL